MLVFFHSCWQSIVSAGHTDVAISAARDATSSPHEIESNMVGKKRVSLVFLPCMRFFHVLLVPGAILCHDMLRLVQGVTCFALALLVSGLLLQLQHCYFECLSFKFPR